MNKQTLNIGHIGIADKVLGYGKRLLIWVAGCPFRCPGCIQPDYLPKNSGKDISISELTNVVDQYLNQLDGITISGGEPLWQSDALLLFLERLPRSLDKMVFTGYRIDELNESQQRCLSYFDLVVDGRYEEINNGNHMWRGSSNQKFYSPTGKYSSEHLVELSDAESAGLTISVEDGLLYFYGIPTSNNEIETISENLELHGILTNVK